MPSCRGGRSDFQVCGLRVMLLWAAAVATQLSASAASGGTTTLPPDLGVYSVVACNSTPQELAAAAEAALWIGRLSGRNLSVLNSSSCENAATRPPLLAVGPSAARTLCGMPSNQLEGLGLEGLVLGSSTTAALSPGTRSPCAFATGGIGAPRGTLYAVTELLELIGVRFLHPEETILPENATMPPVLAKRYVPRFEYRAYDDFTATQFPQWTQRARINSYGNWDPRWDYAGAVGGHVPYCVGVGNQTSPGFCHTAFNLVPPWLVNTSHPEWFGGDPTATVPAGGQLCWGNASLISFLIQRVQLFLRQPTVGAKHGAKIISISNNDALRPTWCARPSDAAIIAEEGSPMGPLLRAVNSVADAIKDEFPDVAISTLAYQHTMKPPRLTVPRPNVIVRLCVRYNSSYLQTSPSNSEFSSDLQIWSRISQRIYIWDYTADFSDFGYMTPFPSWSSLAPNIRHLAATRGAAAGSYAVRGLFSEGDDTSMYGDLQELRSYIITRVSWNPSPEGPTYEALRDEFVGGFYGIAAKPYVLDYIELLSASAGKHGVIGPRKWEGRPSSLFASICQAYLTPEVIVRAGSLMKAAVAVTAVAAPGSRYTDRVARTQLPIYLTVLGRWTEVLNFWKNSSGGSVDPRSVRAAGITTYVGSKGSSHQPLPPWPFEDTFEAAFHTFATCVRLQNDIRVLNTTDPMGRPTSDYYQMPGHAHTMDDSAETAANYLHLITQHGPATPICSKQTTY